MRRKLIIILAIIISVFALTYFYRFNSGDIFFKLFNRQLNIPQNNITQEKKYWLKRMDEVGTQKAYEEFKEENAKKNPSIQHFYIHLFGDMLYSKLGMNGISICDVAFNFGCYHALIARVIAEKGIGIVPEIDQTCSVLSDQKIGSCQHGIGHGLVLYYGYSKDKFNQALNACDKTRTIGFFSSCTLGAFMEYITPLDFIDENQGIVSTKKLDLKNPYEPCIGIPEKSEKACYSTISYWWYMVLRDDFHKIGELCNGINNKEYRRICFYGTGITIATISSYHPSDSITRCKKMDDTENELLCRKGAIFTFRHSPTEKSKADIICNDLPDDFKKRCLNGDPNSIINDK